MPSELDPRRLETFRRALAAHPKTRVAQRALWSLFATAFPGRPQGVGEREWLHAALVELANEGFLRLPAARGRRWDRTMGVAVPISVDLVRARASPSQKTWRGYPWHPRLSWITDLTSMNTEQERFLLRVHGGFVDDRFVRRVPIKYRSLELTGDEKKLERLAASQLFGPSRLTLEQLGCFPDVLPMAWEEVSPAPSIIIFENAGAFTAAHAVLRTLRNPPYGRIGYGGGAAIEDAIRYVSCIEPRVDRIAYVGDLDRDGLRIANAAARVARSAALPAVTPAAGLHRAMLTAGERFGSANGWPHASARRGAASNDAELVGWLPADVRDAVRAILAAGRRIPEEVLGPDELGAAWADASQPNRE